MGPGDLHRILSRLPEESSELLLSSIAGGEDAGVFLLSGDTALVQTVDFFPPIVDDPYTFGQVTAANALSDIYAMGARPLTALNILAYPCGLEPDVLEAILLGGRDKLSEAGALVVGGHTVEDDELKYGICATGVADPARITRISGAVPGDLLVLTKPVGTGVLSSALKAGFVTEEEMGDAISSMVELNAEAARSVLRHDVHACTDVTGFGLAGHLREMIEAGGVGAELWYAEVPLFSRTVEMLCMGMATEAQGRNREFAAAVEPPAGEKERLVMECVYDPQTSGGLLASVDPGAADELLAELKAGPAPRAAVVGTILEAPGRLQIAPGRNKA